MSINDFLSRDFKNETIMLIVGIILFLFLAYIEGPWWAIKELIILFLVVTVFDYVKKLLEKAEKGRT